MKNYLELITEVVKNRALVCKELFGIEMQWTGFDMEIKKWIEEETGEPAPTTILGVTVEYK